jgi:hypothetical protein
MPPTLIPRGLCRAAPTTPIAALTRAFSLTSIRPVNRIPPESPAYLDVPQSPQSQAVEDAKLSRLAFKGHLPIPRKVFRKRSHRAHKTSPGFLAQSAKVPTSPSSQLPAPDDRIAWKRRMAASRRKNLKEGVQQLWVRQNRTETQRRARQRAKSNANIAALQAPQREDERLTESSIPAALLQTAVVRDPLAFRRALASRDRTAALAARKSQERKDALQHMYMLARSFIVSEQELERRVEKLFSADYFSSYGITSRNTEIVNIWDRDGLQPTVQDMVGQVSKPSNKGVVEDAQTATSKRQQRLAEELTGGALDEPSIKL